MSLINKTGVLPDSGVAIVPAGNFRIPFTAVLKSAAAGRALELSADEGVEFFAPTADAQSATMLVVSVVSPVTHVMFTGAEGDAWRIV